MAVLRHRRDHGMGVATNGEWLNLTWVQRTRELGSLVPSRPMVLGCQLYGQAIRILEVDPIALQAGLQADCA